MRNRFETPDYSETSSGQETGEISYDFKPRRDGCLIEFTGAKDTEKYVEIAKSICDYLGFNLTPPEENDLVDGGVLELTSLSEGTLTLEISQNEEASKMEIMLDGGDTEELQEAVESAVSNS